MKMPSWIPARRPNDEISAIPRIIHQTFETHDIAERMHGAAMGWVEMNPDYDYHYSTHEDRRALIATHFGQDVLNAYDRLENGAFRADLWRYCQLYQTGGVYVDIDSICKQPLSELLTPEDRFVAARAGQVPHAIYNGFICAAPGHPFLKAAIRRATRKILAARGPIDGYMVTGPWNLGVAANLCLWRWPRSPYRTGISTMRGQTYRLLKKHPKSPSAPGYLTWQGHIVLLTDYPDYREDLGAAGITHWQAARPKMRVTPQKRLLRMIRRQLFS
jgi:hypothetical protein